MDNKEFNKLLSLWKKEKSMDFKAAVPQKTKDCLYFTELETYAKNGGGELTSAKKQHIQSCAYCQKIASAFKEALQEEEQAIPIYERLTHLLNALANTLALPFKAMPRFAPALVPVLGVIIIFILFSNQPVELKSYSFEFIPGAKTRSIQAPADKTFRIQLVVNSDCYGYLFELDGSKPILLYEEKFIRKTVNMLPKEKWLKGKEGLILLLAREPLKDIPAAQEIIKHYPKDKEKTVKALRKNLKLNSLNLYILDKTTDYNCRP